MQSNTITHIFENVYIGNEDDAKDFSLMKSLGITHILIAGKYMDKHFPNDFTYFQIDIADRIDQDLDLYFDECNQFIKESGKVLVHCVMGKSRSPAIVIGYLISVKGMDFQDALDLVKKKRFITNPNKNFLENLKYLDSKRKVKKINKF